MFGFSRDEMRTLGGGEPEQRPTSMATTSSAIVSPASHPSPPPGPLASELEGSSHATILEWQQAHGAMPQHASEPQHQSTPSSSGIPAVRPDSDPTHAPMIFPEPGQVPMRPTSTVPPPSHSPQSVPPAPLPTLEQSQWLAQQPLPPNAGHTQHGAHLNGHNHAGGSHASSPSQASVYPATQQPLQQPMQYHEPAIGTQHQASLPVAHAPVPGGMEQMNSPESQHIQAPPSHNSQAPSPSPTPGLHQAPQQPTASSPAHPVAPAMGMQQPLSAVQQNPGIQQHAAHPASLPHAGAAVPHGSVQAHQGPITGPSHHYPPPSSAVLQQVPPPTHTPQQSTTPAPGVPHYQTATLASAAHQQHPIQPQGHANPAQSHHATHQAGPVQQAISPMTQPATMPSKTKWKPSRKPAPNHRPSISSMSVGSSISSVSTDVGVATQPISPPTYHQVTHQQHPQVQVQMQAQPILQQPPQYISTTVGQTVSYPWKCSSCGVGLSPKNIYYECLVCSSADLASKLCQTCFLHGANNNSLALGHHVTFYICNQDAVVTDTSIPPQKWTVKQNQFGRRWYQSCLQPVKTHIRPMTAAIPNHSGWIEAKTKQGNEVKVFWVNAVTGETTWQRPPSGMPKGWREVRTPEGKPFYVHDALELATWVYPGHQPLQTPQQTPTEQVPSPQAQVTVQAQISRPPTTRPPTSPQIIHAPQPVRIPLNGTPPVQSPPLPVSVQGQIQVNVGGSVSPPAPPQPAAPMPIPQQTPQPVVIQAQVIPPTVVQQQQLQQKAANKELKKAGKQLGVAAAGGVMSAGLQFLGVAPKQAGAIATGMVNIGKAGVNARRASKPQVQQQSPTEQVIRPTLQGTYSSSNGSDNGVLLTPQSPPGVTVGIQQQLQGQYFVDAQGRPVQYQPIHSPPPTQVTNVQNIQQIQQIQQVQQVQDYGQQGGGTSLDVNIGGLQIGDSGQAAAYGTSSDVVVDNSSNTVVVDNSSAVAVDPMVAQDTVVNNYVVDNTYVSQTDIVSSPNSLYAAPQDPSIVAVDTSSYVDVTNTQSNFVVADTTGFASTATGPVPTDLGGYYSSVDVTDTSVATSSVDANYAYNAMAQQGQEASLGLIDGTTYEDVTVDDSFSVADGFACQDAAIF